MSEVQSEVQVRLAYDARADEYAVAFRSTEPEQPVELAMVNHFAASLRGRRRVLDAGCGAGNFLPILAGLCCEVEGLDLSESYRKSGHDLSLLRYLRSPERMARELTSAGFCVTAQLERAPVGDRELENQAVLIATR